MERGIGVAWRGEGRPRACRSGCKWGPGRSGSSGDAGVSQELMARGASGEAEQTLTHPPSDAGLLGRDPAEGQAQRPSARPQRPRLGMKKRPSQPHTMMRHDLNPHTHGL